MVVRQWRGVWWYVALYASSISRGNIERCHHLVEGIIAVPASMTSMRALWWKHKIHQTILAHTCVVPLSKMVVQNLNLG
jgi:hypothetical protein